jgi:putative cardiolipin synthase
VFAQEKIVVKSVENNFEYPFYAKSNSNKSSPNEMRILHSGIASLQLRLQMIRRAQRSIELEYFIFQNDMSGRIIVTELIKKAQQGVKVRLLIDKSITVIRFDEYYAAELMRHKNIQVSYYNRALDPATAQYRNHRKLLSIDREEALTGGRNIGLDYFDLDPDYNFFDRDIWVKGPIVKAMVDSFNIFWKNSRTKLAKLPYVPEYSRLHRSHQRRNTPRLRVHERRKKEAADFMKETPEMQRLKLKIAKIARPYLEKSSIHTCPNLTFVSDRPGGTILRGLTDDYLTEDRILNQVLKERLKNAKKSVIMESPYFLVNKSFDETLNHLLDKGIDVKVLTNSLGSTDAIYVATNFYRKIEKWIDRDLKTYVFDSKWHAEESDVVINPRIKKTRYGIHAKTFIIDDEDFTIGSYNIDNRSDYFNAEMTLFCEGSTELVEDLKQNVQLRIDHSYLLIRDDEAIDKNLMEADPYAGASDSTIRIMKGITIPASLLEFIM